jgi:YggT family protein
MAGFLFDIVEKLLLLIEWVIIANAIMSWLVAFDVINYRNNIVRAVGRTLDAVTKPFLWPIRRIIPTLGGLDISPVIALVIIEAARQKLVPWIFGLIAGPLGG